MSDSSNLDIFKKNLDQCKKDKANYIKEKKECENKLNECDNKISQFNKQLEAEKRSPTQENTLPSDVEKYVGANLIIFKKVMKGEYQIYDKEKLQKIESNAQSMKNNILLAYSLKNKMEGILKSLSKNCAEDGYIAEKLDVPCSEIENLYHEIY